jgi:mono/diheme cytochrome c family protein
VSRLYVHLVWALACVLAVLGQSAPTNYGFLDHAQITLEGSVLRATANDPRPLAQMLDGLAARFGWNISYEDPQFDFPQDFSDDTSPQWLAKNPQGRHAFAPSGGAFSVSVAGFDVSDPKNEARTLDAVVTAYNQGHNPGKFEILSLDDGSFTVVGIAAAHGSQTPVLNTKISLNVGPVDAYEALDQWGRELSRVSGAHVEGGGLGTLDNSLLRVRVTIHAENLPARDVLRQIIKETNSTRTWLLYFDHDTNSYFLNLESRGASPYIADARSKEPAGSSTPVGDPALIAQGKTRFLYYSCDQCHGAKGEGTNEGPDLINTELSSAEISKFLEHPSPDALMKGMPETPVSSPDHAAILAYVLSLKHPPAK